MRLDELFNVLDSNMSVVLMDEEENKVGAFDQYDSISAEYGACEVFKLSVDYLNRFVAYVEVPTWEVCGKLEVDVTVSVHALTAGYAMDKVSEFRVNTRCGNLEVSACGDSTVALDVFDDIDWEEPEIQ